MDNNIKRRIRKDEVLHKTGYSAATLNDRVREGRFPHPTYEGHIPYWLESEVDRFIDEFFATDEDAA